MSQTDLKGKPKAAMLTNVNLLLEAADRLQNRKARLPGIGVMHGPSGYGKSIAATVVCGTCNAVYVEARSSWTRRKFLQTVCSELGIQPETSISDTAEAIGKELAASDRLLLVDEADTIVDKGFIELVRELHMISDAPVILIGEESLGKKLERWERVHNRVSAWVAAEPATLADARSLARFYVDRVTIEDDLLAYVATQVGRRHRRIVVNLDLIESAAIAEGMETVNRAWWGARELHTGDAATRKLPS